MCFRQVYVCVSLYIYSIEEPGCLGDTGSVGRGLADPLPLHSFFSSSSFLREGVVRVGRGGICYGYVTLLLLLLALLLETQQLQCFRGVACCYL